MKYRISSVTGTEEGAIMAAVTVAIEDALNATLVSRDFGSDLDQVTIIVITAFDETVANKKWAEGCRKLGHVTSEFTGERIRHLSFGTPLERETVLNLRGRELQAYVANAIAQSVEERPKRVAAGLDYPALSASMRQVLRGFDNNGGSHRASVGKTGC
jgi:hypothetical protein